MRPTSALCRRCGATFVPVAAGGLEQKYCSRVCKDRDHYARNRDSIRAKTKICRAANREQIAARNLAWRSANAVDIAVRNRARRYGLSPEDQVKLFDAQRGQCAVCSTAISLQGKLSAHLDHDHDTGEVRAFLCRHCNLMIGHAEDSPSRLRAGAAYLDKRQPKLRLVR